MFQIGTKFTRIVVVKIFATITAISWPFTTFFTLSTFYKAADFLNRYVLLFVISLVKFIPAELAT